MILRTEQKCHFHNKQIHPVDGYINVDLEICIKTASTTHLHDAQHCVNATAQLAARLVSSPRRRQSPFRDAIVKHETRFCQRSVFHRKFPSLFRCLISVLFALILNFTENLSLVFFSVFCLFCAPKGGKST